jgi:hypothetical protein
MSSNSNLYKFTINGNTVTAVYELENGRIQLERMKSNETWTFDGNNVIKSEYENGRLKTSTYSDSDGDGFFAKVSSSTSYQPSSSSYKTLSSFASSEKGYKFDIALDGTVSAVYEVKNGRIKNERIDWNETWSSNGSEVTKVETGFGKVETSVYTDANLNGIFQKTFELDVVTGQNPKSLETFKFLLAGATAATGDTVLETDSITGMLELGRRGWKNDYITSNETLEVVSVGTDNLILKTETQRDGALDFCIYRDDDNDGLWTEIAEGKTLDSYVTLDGKVNLVGLVDAGLLEAAAPVIG